MENFLDHWGLSLAVFLPLVGAAVMMVVPRAQEELHKWIALRKELRLPLPQLADPRTLKALKELQRTMALPEVQIIESSDGREGKLVKVG